MKMTGAAMRSSTVAHQAEQASGERQAAGPGVLHLEAACGLASPDTPLLPENPGLLLCLRSQEQTPSSSVTSRTSHSHM